MKARLLVVVCVLLFSEAYIPGSQARAEQPPPMATRWMGPGQRPLHSPLTGPPELILETKDSRAREVNIVSKGQGRICIVVHEDVYSDISPSLTQYQADLYAMGFSSLIHIYSSGSPEALRDHLAALYREAGSLSGAVFVGDIPYIIYEVMQKWSATGASQYEDFPCDIFFMDLDGTWADVLDEGSVRAGNLKYDTRSGDLGLEIWVSRIRTDNLGLLGSETDLLKAYFDKNHRYRRQEILPGNQALVYNDDDWKTMAGSDSLRMGLLYGDTQVTAIYDPSLTTASDFKTNQLTAPFEFIAVRSHGWTGGHGFYDGGQYERIYAQDYGAINPSAVFYSLFVCSGSDYTADNNLAGSIAFNPSDSGLLAVGTTKTGGMWNENVFYSALSTRAIFGEAFRQWFNSIADRSDAPKWWYGMVLMGDGALARNAFAAYPCTGDKDSDQDVDGVDLSAFIAGPGAGNPLELILFSQDFGKDR